MCFHPPLASADADAQAETSYLLTKRPDIRELNRFMQPDIL